MDGITAPGGSNSRSFDDPWDDTSRIVIGIDIGTTQSGVAFAFLQKGIKPFAHRVTQWPGQEFQNLQGKIPTIVWYDSTNKAVSFGAEGLTPEAEIAAEDEGWKPAKYFKLHLHPPHLTSQHKLDLEPLPFGVPLSQVYSDFLGYLLEHTQTYFEGHVEKGNQMWQKFKPTMELVLAHPNGWGIREQAFLRVAAAKAGFTTASDAAIRVHFVNEAEASVHFCTLYSNIGRQLTPGMTFAVCDAGGSTVDTTVYIVKGTNPIRLEETRVQAGAIFIDQSAGKYLRTILHKAGLSPKEIDDYATHGVKDFELHSKRRFKDVVSDQSIKIAWITYNNTAIRTRRGQMTLQGSEVKTFFDTWVDQIVESVSSQLEGEPVSHVLLVGGFGESPFLRHRLKQRFEPGCDVTTTSEQASKAVADGTIIWYASNIVLKRALQYSYGIEVLVPYNPRAQDHKRRVIVKWPTGTYVKGGWSQIVPGGVPVDCDSITRKEYYREYSTSTPPLEKFTEDIWYYTLKGFLDLLINMVSGDSLEVSSQARVCTTHFRTSRWFTINERAFRLIDSPGFNSTSPSDLEIMKKLVYYLARPRDRNIRLAGVLYLHSESNIGIGRLKKIMNALRNLFGEPWLPSITIAITGNAVTNDPVAVSQLKGSTSPFYSLHSGGAKIVTLSLEIQQIQEILLGFGSNNPKPHFYRRIRVTLPDRVEGVDRAAEEAMRPHRVESTGDAGSSRRVTLQESEASRQQLQAALGENETELKSLRSQLEQTELEYASLHSELQLNDNTEQSKIVQLLGELNRAIDAFGRSVAAYMVDNYKTDRFGEGDTTTLDASNLTGLQDQFGHQAGKSSLVTSSQGSGLPIEDFIDFALRSTIFQKLYKKVFMPFHPTPVGGVESGFMVSLYEKVRRQVAPNIAARWRASTFTALSDGHKLDKPTIEGLVENLVSGDIQQIFNNLFGENNVVTLIESQRNQLQDVITLAWEFNYLLKGEVVALGDFQPVYHECGVPFDPKTMVGFEPNQQRKPNDVAICTVELGMVLYYSKGAENNASPSVVCQATVVTPAIYG
ncbi:unnamed protein product [Rhizoctonia solani]|uniref:Uncharacterized protein n=1 Tax=Rhizoctonia solani TaxID=456999 RepID=A0A8H3D1H3_9AGAM|nr:unnamed protein product [Rhizoctonia solani]